MNFIKKRLFLIVSILLVLAAGGLFFYSKTVEGKNVENNRTVISEYNQLKNLNRELVHKNVLDKIKILADLANKDMEEVKRRAKQTTARPLLNPDIFPEPRGQNPLIKFQKFAHAYCLNIDHFLQKLGAGVPPSQIEEEKVKEKILKRSVNTTGTDGFVSPRDEYAFDQGFSTQRSRTDEQIEIEEFRKERAQTISLYGDTNSFFAYDFWETPQPDDKNALLFDTWFSQLAYWIQEDVVLAIAQINEDSKSLPTSPIKRLIEISFQGPSVGTSGTISLSAKSTVSSAGSRFATLTNLGAARRVSGSQVFLPVYVLPPKPSGDMMMAGNVENVGQITNSWTHRTSGDLIDVVQFELGLIIDTIKIDDFINALQSEKSTEIIQKKPTQATQYTRNQITVLQIMIEPLEIDLEKQSGFYYGPGSLAVLRLIGEYVFFKSGYEAHMPKPVKDILAPPEPSEDADALLLY